jgi:hypothetical protein
MPPLMIPLLTTCPLTVPLTNTMPEGLIVPLLMMLPAKLVFWTQTLVTVTAALLVNGPVIVMLQGAASAARAPVPIKSAATELDANNRPNRPRGLPNAPPTTVTPPAALKHTTLRQPRWQLTIKCYTKGAPLTDQLMITLVMLKL